jgi:hypothetical protein
MRRTSLLLAVGFSLFASRASAQSAPPPPPVAAPSLQAYAPAPGYSGYSRYAPPPVIWPTPPSDDARGAERRSPALIATGFTMVGVGLATLSFGAFAYMVESSIQYDGDCMDTCVSRPTHSIGSVATMIAGGVLFAVGLPLGIYGATKQPRGDDAMPEVAVGPSAARLRWAF